MLSAPDFEEKQILFALLSRGDHLSFKNDNIIIKDEEGKVKHQSSCYKLFILFVCGHITITSGLIQKTQKFQFTIVLLNHNLRYYGQWSAGLEGNVLLRRKQYEYNGIGIAQHLISNKIQEQIVNLKKVRHQNNDIKKAIEQLYQHHQSVIELNPLQNDVEKSLLGLEGSAARAYFGRYFADWNWTARRPRVKHDICNFMLDIGYTLLFHFIEALLRFYGFDLYQGVYHKVFYQRKSLVCDLEEPFRPLIDAALLKAHNLGQIHEEDFFQEKGRYSLEYKKSSYYSQIFLSALLKHKQEIFYYVQRYYRAFIREDYQQLPIFSRGQ